MQPASAIANRRRLLLAAPAAAVGLPLALPVLAAPSARAIGGAPVVMDDQLAYSLIASLLTLDELQDRRLRAALAEASRRAAPIAARLDTTRNALFDAVKAGASDAELAAAGSERGQLQGQLLVLQATTFRQLWALLTPEQRAAVQPTIFSYIGELLSSAAARRSVKPG